MSGAKKHKHKGILRKPAELLCSALACAEAPLVILTWDSRLAFCYPAVIDAVAILNGPAGSSWSSATGVCFELIAKDIKR
jgi:hypothetical protein